MANTQTEPLRMLRVKEVAQILSCHPHTVLRLVQSGQLRSVRFGGPGGGSGYHRFDPREIERFVAGGKSDERPA